MHVVYNLDRPIGSRVHNVTLLCLECDIPRYEPLNSDKEYKILTSSFVAGGGDGYSMFPGELLEHENLGK